jgi:hypothetical protein
MATDIRRMSKEELDELNRVSKEWRKPNKPIQDKPAQLESSETTQNDHKSAQIRAPDNQGLPPVNEEI